MLVFVEHKETSQPYILLGTGLGMYRSESGRGLLDTVKEGVHKIIAVCDKSGEIHWFPSKELTVITVDGKAVEDHWL
ncbi:MAG: hypothetical protein AAF960_07160 [Bacteroidota bacterium]